jgi:hypothetical protein
MVRRLSQDRATSPGPVSATWSDQICEPPRLGRTAAYASQFLDPINRAWRIKAKVKARLIGDEDPNGWDLPPKPKGMRCATYEKWEAKYDAAEDAIDALCGLALARLMKRG